MRKLVEIMRVPSHRRLALGIAGTYFVLFLWGLQDISRGGRGFAFLTANWSRALDRTGSLTFEPVAQLTLPGLTVLLSPINMLMGVVLSVLAGLNLLVTYIALTRPWACGFNRSTGVLASLPALLAGSACCAPAVLLILGIQASSLFIGVFQVLIPASLILLLITLKFILDRTNTDLLREEG